MVQIEIDESTFATLIAGLYVSFTGAEISAIPPHFWLGIANELSKYMDYWKYDVMSLEEWIGNHLIVTVEEILSPEEIQQFENFPIFIRIGNGNATLIGAGEFIWDCSNTSTKEETNMS